MATASDVIDQIGSMAKLYRHDVDGPTISFYAEVLLERLTPDDAHKAIRRWMTQEPRWPAPAQIIELVYPRREIRDDGAELSQSLMTLIATKGYTWESTCRYDGYASAEEGVQVELGDAALGIVQRCGGWARFCKEWGGEEGDGTARAQLRNLCEAAMKNPGMPRPMLDANRKQHDAIGEFIVQQKALRAKAAREAPPIETPKVSHEEYLEKLQSVLNREKP